MNFEGGRLSATPAGRQECTPGLGPKVADCSRRYGSVSLADVQRRMQILPGKVTLSIDWPEDFVGYNEIILRMGKLVFTTGCIEARRGYDLHFKAGDEYIVNIPFCGHGWASTGATFVEYSHEDLLVVSPHCCVEKHWNGPGEVFSIHIPVDRFDRVFATGGVSAPSFAPILRIERRRLRSLMRMVETIWEDLQDSHAPSPFLNAPLSDQTEDMLLHLLLVALREEAGSGRETALPSPAAPSYVRRAKSFIDSNAHFSIDLEQVAEAAGVSARTLQYGFREFLDNTPMQYVRFARHRRAREILQRDCSNRTITDIAIEIGCPNVSQFSRDYRSVFGETPSDTILARRRGLQESDRTTTPSRDKS